MALSASLQTFVCIYVIRCATVAAAAEVLPLCPTDVNYLPQSLPMHCRMPRNAVYPMFPGVFPNLTFPPLPPVFQNPLPDKRSPPLAIEMAPGPPRVAPMPMPMMPAAVPGPAHKLPVIVMPFYSPDGPRNSGHGSVGHHGQKKRRIHINKKSKARYPSDTDMDSETDTSDTDDTTDTSGDTSSADSAAGWWTGRRSGKRPVSKRTSKRWRYRSNKELLTPVLQYVTKDGYVIYEKRISKNQANEWLQDKREDDAREYNDPPKGEHNQKQVEDEAEEVAIDNDTDRQLRKGPAAAGDARATLHKHPHRRKPKTPGRKKAEAR